MIHARRGWRQGEQAVKQITNHQNGRIRGWPVICIAVLILLLEGCAVVAIADAAVTVVATTVKVGAKVVGAAVDLVIPDSDQKEKK